MNPDNDREESILIKTERAAENAVNKALSERWARVRWLVAAVASLAAALGYASVPQWLSREVSNQVGKEVERHKGTVEQLHTELEGVRGQLREVREKIQAELDATQRHVDLIGKVMRQQVERDRDDFGAKVQSDFRVVAEDSRRVQDLARQANEDARKAVTAALDEVVQVTASRLAEDHSAIRSAALKALRHMWTPTLSDKVERDALVRVEEAARRAVSSDAKGDLEEALMVFARTRSRLGTERLKSLVLDQDLPDGVRLAAVQKMGLGLTPADETVRALQGLEADEHLKQDLRQAATTQRTQLEQRRARTN